MAQASSRLVPHETAVIVVDVQERLAPAMPEQRLADVRRSARILVGGARELGARVFYTEQYPKGLGSTLPELAGELAAAAATRLEKLDFSACACVADALTTAERRSVVLIGMETHVCVYLTARDFLERGFAVHIAADGVASRRDDHRQVGLDLCARAGALITTSETVVFDWMARAGTPSFKTISALVR